MALDKLIQATRRGRSDQVLGNEVGLSSQRVQQLRSGKPRPKNFLDPDTVKALVQALRVDFVSLMVANAESIDDPELHAMLPVSTSMTEFRPGTIDGSLDVDAVGLTAQQKRLVAGVLSRADGLRAVDYDLINTCFDLEEGQVAQVLMLAQTMAALNAAKARAEDQVPEAPQPRKGGAPPVKPRRQRVVGQLDAERGTRARKARPDTGDRAGCDDGR